MSKFNNKSQSINKAVKSHEGGIVYQATPYQELCDRVLTSFYGEDKFYESAQKSNDKLIKLIHQVGKQDPIFVLKLAILAREQFYLRTISQVIISEISKIYKGDSRTKQTIARIIQRPDDMTEILSYIINSNAQIEQTLTGQTRHKNKKIPNSIKKGIAIAIHKFDEYQLSKYNSSKKEVKLKDVFNLTHPKPANAKQAKLWESLITGTIKQAETWERKISASGKEENAEEAKKEAWENLIKNNKLGYMATLRNINNFLKAGLSNELHIKVQKFISNEKAVLNSKQLPFRFYSAYKMISENKDFDPFTIKHYKKALEQAMHISVKNIKSFKGRTMVVVDTSGSMESFISQRSTMTMLEIGCVLGSVVNEMADDAIIAAFATDFKLVDINKGNILKSANKIRNTSTGYATNVHLIFEWLNKNNIKIDNLIILSDMEVMRGISNDEQRYRHNINNDLIIYEWNLNSYGHNLTNTTDPKHIKMTGWNDSMIKFITEFNDIRLGIIDMVNKVNLNG